MIITDIDRLNFLEETARLSRTGVSFDWDGTAATSGYRFMSRHNIGQPQVSIRKCIDTAINERGWKPK